MYVGEGLQKRVYVIDGRFLASFNLLTSLPRRTGFFSDRLDHIPPAGKLGATTIAVSYDTL